MKNFINLVAKVASEGEPRLDRTGVGTKSIFGTNLKWDLKKGFPAVTTKSLAWKAVVGELLWFLSGSTNVEYLRYLTHGKGSNKPTIWDANYQEQALGLGYTNGELGPVYGKQWRNHSGVDQIQNLIDSILEGHKTGVYSRRMIVSAWNPAEIEHMALPPCHYAFEVYISNNKELSLMWHQRSVDIFLGLPFNIASYALLTHILAQITGCTVGTLKFTGGDTHVYNNHLNQVAELLNREPLSIPTLGLPEFTDLNELIDSPLGSIKLLNYRHAGKITAPMAV